MPELPDVEGFRRVLAEHAVGSTIERVEVLDDGVLREVSADELASTLRGQRFDEPCRRGKWLIVPVTHGEGPVLLLHFGMTGALLWAGSGEERHRHDRIVFGLSDGELRYRDMRKLQGVRPRRDDRDVQRALADVGPDAAESTFGKQLRELLRGRLRQLTAALVASSVLA